MQNKDDNKLVFVLVLCHLSMQHMNAKNLDYCNIGIAAELLREKWYKMGLVAQYNTVSLHHEGGWEDNMIQHGGSLPWAATGHTSKERPWGCWNDLVIGGKSA